MPTSLTRPSWVVPVPNLLTGLRIALALAFPFVPPAARAPIVLAAAASDWFDGWIARTFRAETAFGALIDGAADKLFALSAVVTLIAAGVVPWWAGPVVLARDLAALYIGATFAARGNWGDVFASRPRLLGKLTTASAFVWFAAVLLPLPVAVRTASLAVTAVVSVAAAADYLIHFLRGRPRGAAPDAGA